MTSHTKVAVLTGSTGGIGLEISQILARQGWDLALVNRSQEKAAHQQQELKQSYPNQSFQCYQADLLDVSDLYRVSDEITGDYPKISALYNIAGILTDRRMMSPQNVEGHFAVNTIAPYILMQRLRKQLSAGSTSESQSVVVNFSSSAIKGLKKLEVAQLSNPKEIGGLMGAYARTKLALDVMGKGMEKELSEESILIVAADPGPTKTTMTGSGDGMPWFLRLLQPFLFKSAKQQAERLVRGVQQAVADKKTGLYISEGQRKKYPAMALDGQLQRELRALLDSFVR